MAWSFLEKANTAVGLLIGALTLCEYLYPFRDRVHEANRRLLERIRRWLP